MLQKYLSSINEAYEYLDEYIRGGSDQNSAREDMIREWHEYRRAEARKRAYANAKTKYSDFTNSKTYRASMVLK